MSITATSPSHIPSYQSIITKWYRTIDPVILTLCFMLIFIGGILIASGGGAVARRIGISGDILPPQWWFLTKHIVFAGLSMVIMIGMSFLDIKSMRRIGVIMFCLFLPILALTLVAGSEIKGSRRWVMGIQPSEFIKPGFIILNAWLMSLPKTKTKISGTILSLLILCLTAMILLLQPDLGQTILLCAAWVIMFFVSGGHILWFVAIGGASAAGAIGAYYTFSHVQNRVDGFLNPSAMDRYGVNFQYETAKRAFASGGFTGRGPGEGEVKAVLPDAHTDYIFAVAGEEFGVIFCWAIIMIYALIVIRCLWRISNTQNRFTMLAGAGLISLFGVQSVINISVNLGLLPPKGMTLPFISYGGSSAVALGFLTGFILCLSRKRPYGYSV